MIYELNGQFNKLIVKSGITDEQARLTFYKAALPRWLHD